MAQLVRGRAEPRPGAVAEPGQPGPSFWVSRDHPLRQSYRRTPVTTRDLGRSKEYCLLTLSDQKSAEMMTGKKGAV